jgi:transcriptional regulator of acetoin/glycerol metabolism
VPACRAYHAAAMSDSKPQALVGEPAAAAAGRRESPSLSLVAHAHRSNALAPTAETVDQPLASSTASTASTAERLTPQQAALLEQADPVMELLFRQLDAPQGSVVLLDMEGHLLHAVGHVGQGASAWAASREPASGAHALRHSPSSRAALLLNPEGDVAAQLDWVAEAQGAGSSAAPWVAACARMIENRWLCAQHQRAMRIHFHRFARSLGGLAEGILAVSPDERIVGANRQALELLGMGRAALRRQSLKSLLGVHADILLNHFKVPGATALNLHLPDGRSVLAYARCEWPVWSTIADAAARQPSARAARQAAHWSEEAPGWSAWLTGDTTLEKVVEQLQNLVGRDVPLLIEGEAGTGKTWLARAVHAESPRREGPFVAVSCALRPVAALDAELFGVPLNGSPASGQADSGVTGKLMQADGGTVFLDDIDELPPELQQRLALFVQSRQLQAAPWTRPVPVDVAIIACSQYRLVPRALDTGAAAEPRWDASPGAVSGGRRVVLAPLYHALNGWAVRLPALRERQDFPALVRRLLDASLHAPHLSLSDELLRRLQGYAWPGNVGQLVQVLRAAALQAGTQRWIRPEHLPPVFWEELCHSTFAGGLEGAAVAGQARGDGASFSLGGAAGTRLSHAEQDLEAIERAAILQAVEQAGGNVSLAARRLGVSRNTVYRRLRTADVG